MGTEESQNQLTWELITIELQHKRENSIDTIYEILSSVLTIALAPPIFGQDSHDEETKTDMKHHDPSGMMGTPTVGATVKGVHPRVWLMTQKQHKVMMNGKKDQKMMHGEKKGAKGQSGMNDSSMQMGKETKGMKHDGMGGGNQDRVMSEISRMAMRSQ